MHRTRSRPIKQTRGARSKDWGRLLREQRAYRQAERDRLTVLVDSKPVAAGGAA